MKRLSSSIRRLVLVAGFAAAMGSLLQAEPVVKPGFRVAVVGDSITEQKLYSRYIELYLLCCQPQLEARVMQFGWGGERAAGFLNRMENDMGPFQPNVVTTCYGMNDGGYRAFTPDIGKAYETPMRGIVERLKAAGVTVVVGSPGVVDSHYFRNDPELAKVYNENLAQLRDIARQVAADHAMPFANVHDTMMDAMVKAKAALGETYDVGGRDGVHPGPNGHLAMAAAFLRAMGFEGDLGTIAIDLAGPSTATGGHRVLTAEAGKVDLESSRYVFCFSGDETSSGGTRSLLPYLPFNQELNRLMLTVKGLAVERARVTWGEESKEFARAQLESGINLAAEFPRNPFGPAFGKVEQAVAAKQGFETAMIKGQITNYAWLDRTFADDAEALAATKLLRQKLWQHQEKLAVQAREALQPVKHTLLVQPIAP